MFYSMDTQVKPKFVPRSGVWVYWYEPGKQLYCRYFASEVLALEWAYYMWKETFHLAGLDSIWVDGNLAHNRRELLRHFWKRADDEDDLSIN